MKQSEPGAGAAIDLEARVSDILGAGLDEFISARDGLARELKKLGRGEDAAGVAALRKPGLHLWAVNQLARQRPVAVRRLVSTAADLADAQGEVLSGTAGAGDRLRRDSAEYQRALDQAVREARAMLHDAGRGAGEESLRRVREVLANAATGTETSRDLLLQGGLREEPEAPGFGMFAGAEPPAPKRATVPAERVEATGTAADSRAATRAEQRARRAAEEAEREQLKVRRAALQRDLDHAEADLKRAEQTARRLRRRAEATAAEARTANEDAEAAEAALEQARAAVEAARAAL